MTATTRPSSSRLRSFTLIELLAVVVILGLAAGAGLVGLGAMDAASERHAFDAALQALDQDARLRARMGGAMTIRVNDEVGALQVVEKDAVLHVLATEPYAVQLQDDTGQMLSAIHFDASGRSIDYHVTRRDDADVARWRVAGLTGAWTKETAP